jgi:hypothetical protein
VEEKSLSSQEIDARVRRLTVVATNLFKRGSYQPAFDSLMKAYLLDPSSPHVLACEKTLLPVLELMRERGMFSSGDSHNEGAGQFQLARRLTEQMTKLAGSANDLSESQRGARPAKPEPDPLQKLQEERIMMLKQKHQQAQQQREQQMWRDASKPPRVPLPARKDSPENPPTEPSPPSESQKASEGLFSKIKQGKFFT